MLIVRNAGMRSKDVGFTLYWMLSDFIVFVYRNMKKKCFELLSLFLQLK